MEDEPIPLAEAIKMRLRESLGPVGHADLAPHLARDAVFMVAPGIDLLDCGVAIARDDVDKVGEWIRRGELRKPSQAERTGWAEQAERRWVSVVDQPFVLIQEPAGPTEVREAKASLPS